MYNIIKQEDNGSLHGNTGQALVGMRGCWLANLKIGDKDDHKEVTTEGSALTSIIC
jgi:hypothetical protein